MTSLNPSRVMIGVPTAEFARQAIFYDHFNAMDKPEGTVIVFAHGQSPARNRNLIIEGAIEHNCTHLLFIDDDCLVPKDMLTRLMKHEVPAVMGLYLKRSFPHEPIIFDYADERGYCHHYFPKEGENGLLPIVGGGLGCCLLDVNIFKLMERPWIRLGELEKDHWSDDTGFFKRLREHDIKVYCDLDTRVGHLASVTIWPSIRDGKWCTTYDTSGTASVTIPAQVPVGELQDVSR